MTYSTLPEQTTVLVVDDEQYILRIISHLLDSVGLRVITTTRPYEAIELVKNQPPDIIICDLLIPEMDGFTFLRHIRGLPLPFQPPIVIMSGSFITSSNTESEVEPDPSVQTEASAFLAKPFDRTTLLRVIEMALKKR